MKTIKKFKEAAIALQQDEIYSTYHVVRKNYDSDTELQEKIGEFQLAKLQLDKEMQKSTDERNTEKTAALNEKINTLYNEIMESESMQKLTAARKKIEDFVSYVNEIINTAIDGGDPMIVQPPNNTGECGDGGCSGCSGCR